MSTGLVICSTCKRELKQDGPRAVENGWRHHDDSPRCTGAETRYPTAEDLARCEARMSNGLRCEQAGVKWLPTRESWQTMWVCEGAHASPFRYAGPGAGRNNPCPCGSGRKSKKCCGGAS